MMLNTSTPYDNMRFFKAHHAALFEKTTEDGEVYVGESDRPWVYLNCSSIAGLQKLVDALPVIYVNFALVEDWMVEWITRDYKRTREMICKRLYLPDNVKLPPLDVDVCKLEIEDALEIQKDHAYNDYTDIKYVKNQIKNGYGAGVKVGGKLVAWAITHDDGAIGFLFVQPEYRNKGYGEAVTVWIADRLRKDGYAVYVHIESDNYKSMTLAKKMGFEEDRNVRWFTLEEAK